MSAIKTFSDLRKINVNEHIEKKGNLSYLSWTWAVDHLLQHDPNATWEFKEPKMYGQTMMVFCEVTALGKTLKMHLPVMDNRNNALANPDARKISDAMMRCLAKCIACFGIGLYIYAGEDLPEADHEGRRIAPDQPGEDEGDPNAPTVYRISFGQWKTRTLEDVAKNFGLDKIASYIDYLEDTAKKKNKPIEGTVKEFIERAGEFLVAFEKNAPFTERDNSY